jgi:hypothetical protein
MLLHTSTGIKRPSLSSRARAIAFSPFGRWYKLSTTTKARLSASIIKEFVRRRSFRLHLFKSSVILVLKVVAIEIVFLALVLVLLPVLAKLVIFNLPLFVSILVLVSKLTLFSYIFLELVAS